MNKKLSEKETFVLEQLKNFLALNKVMLTVESKIVDGEFVDSKVVKSRIVLESTNEKDGVEIILATVADVIEIDGTTGAPGPLKIAGGLRPSQVEQLIKKCLNN